MDTNLLLTDEEYRKQFEGQKHPVPYVYELHSVGQLLFYFGVRHSRSPEDTQWEKLKSSWEEFSRKASQRRIILLEGGEFTPEGERADIIRKYGEAGALVSLARDTSTEFAWPDLSIDMEAQRLAMKFEQNLVAYFIFVRSAGAWLRGGALGTFDEVLAKAAIVTSRRIPGAPSDVASYVAIHDRVFGKILDESQKEVLIRASAPVYHDSVINDIARASSRLRNEHIVGEVERYWKDGYSIFLLFGSAHAVIQEQALRAMVGGDIL